MRYFKIPLSLPEPTPRSVEKADVLLMAMPPHVAADDGAVKDIEHCEQRGGAVTFESSNCFAPFGNRPNESDH
jgi:hypothetical protein